MLVQIVTENGQKKVIPLTADAGAGNPVGTIIPMYKKSSPSGYLYCDGSTFDETKYPLLYAYLGSNVLPDYREFALVGAEENTTDVYNASTNPNGTIHDHDVYTEGQAKDDRLQNITGSWYGERIVLSGSAGGAVTQTNSQTFNLGSGENGNQHTLYSFDASRVARTGTTTRGKRKAVYFYIKATSGLSENAQDNVVAQINEQRSYNTEEHWTGKKWIDGKNIYSKTVYIASTSSGVLDISSMNIDTPIAVVNAVAYKYNGVADKQALPLLSGQIRGGIAFQHASLTVTRGDASYNYGDIYITLEYTKTTD